MQLQKKKKKEWGISLYTDIEWTPGFTAKLKNKARQVCKICYWLYKKGVGVNIYITKKHCYL